MCDRSWLDDEGWFVSLLGLPVKSALVAEKVFQRSPWFTYVALEPIAQVWVQSKCEIRCPLSGTRLLTPLRVALGKLWCWSGSGLIKERTQ